MKFKLNLILYFLIIVNSTSLCISSSNDIFYRFPGDDGYNVVSVSPFNVDVRYTTPSNSGRLYIAPTNHDTTGKLSIDSYSTGSYYVGAQGPTITIDKFTKDFGEVYNKNNNITIKIKIINNNKENRLENVYIYEDIPDKFECIDANPEFTTKSNKSNTIIWALSDTIRRSNTLEYTIRTNKSGKHNLGNTMLEATVVDKNGRKNDIILVDNNRINILIQNTPPKFSTIDPEPPLSINRGFFNDKHVNEKYINVSLTDIDNDTISCELLLAGGCKSVKPIFSDSNTINGILYYNYAWDLAGFNDGTHILALDAFDGDDHTMSHDIELNIYKITPEIKTALLTILVIVIAGLVVRHSSKYSSIKRKLDTNWIMCYMIIGLKQKIRGISILTKLNKALKSNAIFVRLKNNIDTKKQATKEYMNQHTPLQGGTSSDNNDNIGIDEDFDDQSLPPEQRKKHSINKEHQSENDLHIHENSNELDSLSDDRT